MKKITRTIINKVSNIDYEIAKTYQFQRKFQELGSYLVPRNSYIDTFVLTEDINVPIRIFFPIEQTDEAIIYYHGGGWVIGNLHSHSKICYDLAIKTKKIVISVDYRLAPEFPYPAALDDCYAVTKYFYTKDNFLSLNGTNITLMGDSAGGTLAASISLLSRDRKDFKVKKQVLIYPLTYFDHSVDSPFKSINENGENWILTTKKLNEYMDLYIKNKEDLNSPYVAPLNATNLKKQPDTLVITSEFDPLRDEGEAYGLALAKHNKVIIKRIDDTIHGFLNLPVSYKETQLVYEYIDKFLKGEINET